ncbi:GNAT family N-acetyltransferase, partial [Streptomyces sp. NPDC057557]
TRPWRRGVATPGGGPPPPPPPAGATPPPPPRPPPEQARAEHKHRYLHAYPSVDNGASNAVCRKAGFTLIGTCDFEYPPGNVLLTNDWQLDLAPDSPDAGR